jgi:hypothetical protein
MDQIFRIDFLKIEPKTKTKAVGNEKYTIFQNLKNGEYNA